MLKLTRHSTVFSLLWAVFREEARSIGALIFILCLTLTISGALAYMRSKNSRRCSVQFPMRCGGRSNPHHGRLWRHGAGDGNRQVAGRPGFDGRDRHFGLVLRGHHRGLSRPDQNSARTSGRGENIGERTRAERQSRFGAGRCGRSYRLGFLSDVPALRAYSGTACERVPRATRKQCVNRPRRTFANVLRWFSAFSADLRTDHEKWVTRLSRTLFNRALLEKGRGWRGHQTRTAMLFWWRKKGFSDGYDPQRSRRRPRKCRS